MAITPPIIYKRYEDISPKDVKEGFITYEAVSRKHYLFTSCYHFEKWIREQPEGKRTHWEKIPPGNSPRKLYLDIDCKDVEKIPANFKTVISKIIIKTMLSEYGKRIDAKKIVFLDGNRKDKFSMHIVIKGYTVNSNLEAKYFAKCVKNLLPDEIPKNIIDLKVYNDGQNFRCADNHKSADDLEPMRIVSDEHTFLDSLITYTKGCRPLPAKVLVVEKTGVQQPAIDDSILTKVLDYLPIEISEKFKYRETKGNLVIFDRIKTDDCCFQCKRRHTSDGIMIAVYVGKMYVFCRRYFEEHEDELDLLVDICNDGKIKRKQLGLCIEFPDNRVDGDCNGDNNCNDNNDKQDAETKRKLENMKACNIFDMTGIDILFDVVRYSSNTVNNYIFDDVVTARCESSPMGTGKTVKMCELISTLKPTDSVLMVEARQTLTDKHLGDLGKVRKFNDYRELRKHGSKIPIKDTIVQFESLDKLDRSRGIPHLLILDEVEAIISQESNIRQNMGIQKWYSVIATLEWLVKYSKNILVLDANIGPRTLNLLKKRPPNMGKVLLSHNTIQTGADREYYVYNTKSAILDTLIKTIRLGRKVCLCTNSKILLDSTIEVIRAMFPGINIKSYTSDSSEQDRLDFRNVGIAWDKLDFLCFTPTVMAGVSYEGDNYDCLFGIFDNRCGNWEHAIQMHGRIRKLKLNQYHIYLAQYGKNCAKVCDMTEFRNIIKQKEKELLKDVSNVDAGFARFHIGPDGCYQFEWDEFSTSLYLTNICEENRSYNNYSDLFWNAIKRTGAKIIEVNDTVIDQAVKEQIHEAVTNHYKLEIKDIADAVIPQDLEELYKLEKRKDKLTKEQKAILEKYRLAKFYEIKDDLITADFITKYDIDQAKTVFSNLNYVCKDGMIIADRVTERVTRGADQALYASEKKDTITKIKHGNEVIRHREAVNLLKGLGVSITGDHFVIPASITRETVAKAAKELSDQITDDTKGKLYATIFGTKPHAFSKLKKQVLKGQIKSVLNPILEKTYGMMLVSKEGQIKGRESKEFTISESKLFVWNVIQKRYVVKTP